MGRDNTAALLAAAFIAGAGSSLPAPAWAHPPACGTYRVAFYETGLLYFKDRAGEHVGIDRSVIEELARRTGCHFVRFMDSRVRIWAALAKGQLDMTVSGIETPQRREFATFIPYLTNNRNYLLVRNALADRIGTMQDFEADKSLRVGVVKGFVHGAELDAWLATLRSQDRVDEVSDLEVLARVFAAGRVNAFLTQPVVWPPLLERNHLVGKVKMLDIAPRDSAVLGLVLSRNRVAPADAVRMRSAMDAMRADGTLEAIIAHYLGPSTGPSSANRQAGP